MIRRVLLVLFLIGIGLGSLVAKPAETKPDPDIFIVTIKTTYDKILEFKVNDFKIKRSKLTVINSVDYGFPVKNTIYHDEIVSVEIEPVEDEDSITTEEMQDYLKKLNKKGYRVAVHTDSTKIDSAQVAEE